jgi:hypothetical protein
MILNRIGYLLLKPDHTDKERQWKDTAESSLINTSAAIAVAVLLVLISIFAIIGGTGLLRRRAWARVLDDSVQKSTERSASHLIWS